MKNTNIEVEGGEILLQSKEGHYAVIPTKHRQKVMDMVDEGCDDCINSYIQTLPKESDYAEDGTLVSRYSKSTPNYTSLYSTSLRENAQPSNTIVAPSAKAPIDLSFKPQTAIAESSNVDTIQNNPIVQQATEKKLTNAIEKTNKPKQSFKSTSLLENYEKKSQENEIKKVEKFYKNYKPETKEEVIKIQKLLKKEGYDLGNYGEKKDGIDGKFGDNTKLAYEDYLKKKFKKDTSIDLFREESRTKCDEEGCAEYVSHVLDNAVLGDAWTMKNNIEKQGKTIKYNIYDDVRFKNIKSATELKRVTEEVKKENKATKDMFKVGDAIGIYNPSSDMHETALKEGKGTYNTHVGVVTSIREDGTPIITHNVYGKLFHQPYNTLKIGWIGESGAKKIPKYNDQNKSTSVAENINYYTNDLPEKLGIDIDKTNLKKDIAGIIALESGFGKHKPTDFDIEKSKLQRKLTGNNSEDGNVSKGLSKMKGNTLSFQEKIFLGVDNININNDKENIKAATFNYLKHYKQFSDYAEANPQLNLTQDDIRNMTILSHNQGSKKLLNLGYNNSNLSIEEEVKKLRDITRGKVKDITSTKFNHIPIIGENLYDMKFPDGHPTYIGRVREHGERLASKDFKKPKNN